MERGYLYLLIGAALTATTLLPFNINPIPFISLTFIGYLLVLTGIRSMRTSEKELKNAYHFAIATLIIPWLLRLFTMINMTNFFWIQFLRVLSALGIFASIGIFFWLFKAEYMWSPKRESRIDWLMYSIVSFVYLVLYVMIAFPTISLRFLTPAMAMLISEGARFVNILRYIILLYVLAKLYLDVRKNVSDYKPWH